MKNKNMKDFEFFTLNSTERIVNKENGTMYLLIRPNQFKIRNIEESTFLVNISTIELTVNLKNFTVTNHHKQLMFSDLEMSEVSKFESTFCLNELKSFKEFLEVDSNRADKHDSKSLNKTKFSKEIEEMFEFLESSHREQLIDTALEKGDKDLFDKLTS